MHYIQLKLVLIASCKVFSYPAKNILDFLQTNILNVSQKGWERYQFFPNFNQSHETVSCIVFSKQISHFLAQDISLGFISKFVNGFKKIFLFFYICNCADSIHEENPPPATKLRTLQIFCYSAKSLRAQQHLNTTEDG